METNNEPDCVDWQQTALPDRNGEQDFTRMKFPSIDFIATFAHELRNSLGALRNASQILRTDPSGDPRHVNAQVTIERQVGQMTRLIEDLLDVARMRTGKQRLACERVELCQLVATSLQAVEFLMQQRAHRVTVALPQRPVWIHADPVRLEQVFVNLLSNAAKYTGDGGEVKIHVEECADEATVRILDTGVGIAADVLPHVFDFYFQVDSSSRNRGLGLGLPLVRSLVESHGGGVTAVSAGLGRGSVFTVRLPLLKP
jgi:signal transduction histidine kinase